MDTHTWETLRNLGNIAGSNLWGAAYAVGTNLMYASENNSGVIYRFNIATGANSLVIQGPTTSQNDGARCINAPAPGSGT
ncbi:hypothetical protein BKA59DRAFT_475120 [Fusarium tricinctum]|nr:hypothetical protein BKA59DRAFT_475120 [Fusarium tricinctum]